MPVYSYPVSPTVAPIAQSPVVAPSNMYANSSNTPLFQFGRSANPTAAVNVPANGTVPLVPISAQANQFASNTRQSSLFRWPSWLSGNGPLMKSSLFNENRTLPDGSNYVNPALAAASSPNVGFGGSLPYGYQQQSVLPQTSGLKANPLANSRLPSSQMASTMIVRPTTTSVFPTRTAEQSGMPATNFR